jgi:cysteinyl-tRNA synthetase
VMFFVRSHYRKPVDYSAEALEQAGQAVARIRELGRRLDPSAEPPSGPLVDRYEERFRRALSSDFNTPAALTEVFDFVADLNRRLDDGASLSAGPLRDMLWVLGLDGLLDADADAGAPDAEAERLLAEREQARAARDFATADARRDELAALGWQVRDTPEGPRLVRSG